MSQFLNIERAFYDGVGEYNIPVIQPVEELPKIDSWIANCYCSIVSWKYLFFI